MMEVVEQKEVIKNELYLIDIIALLWRKKLLIILPTFLAAFLVVVYCVISLKLPPEKTYMPNVYTPEAQMLINNKDGSGGVSSLLNSSGLSGLASLAGVNVGGGGVSNSALATYLVYSNSFLDAVVDNFNLIDLYEIKKSPKTESRNALKMVLETDYSSSTGVFTVKFTNKDPEFACEVINFVVDLLEKRFLEIGIDQNKLTKANLEENIRNSYDEILSLQMEIQNLESSVSNGYNPNGIPSIMMDTSLLKMELSVQEQIYASLKTQYETLKVTMASEKPVFQILEYAEIPDKKSGPSRGKLCFVVTFGTLFLSLFFVFVTNILEKLRENNEIVSKFKVKK